MARRSRSPQHKPYPHRYKGETLTGWCNTSDHEGCPFTVPTQAGIYHCSCSCHTPLERVAGKGAMKLLKGPGD